MANSILVMDKSEKFRVAIIGNGDINVVRKTLETEYDYVIAADGGANYCVEKKIEPDIIIGDGDSISDEAQEYFDDMRLSYVKDQNSTDLEKALRHAHTLADNVEITLYGFTSGQRLDHTQAAIQWLIRDRSIRCVAAPMQGIFFVDTVLRLPNPDKLFLRVSIIPYTPTATITIVGMEWSGKDIVLNNEYSAISNRTIGYTPYISVTEGSVLVFVGL